MNILTAEQAIVTKLAADITTVRVESYPDNPTKYQMLHPIGALLVQYVGSSYNELEEEAIRGKRVNQIRVLEWRIVLLYRNLHGHTGLTSGIYTYLEAVRESLTGFTITGFTHAGVMYPVSDGIVGRDEKLNLWEYEVIFNHTYPESIAFQ